jgi:hypothetical protein
MKSSAQALHGAVVLSALMVWVVSGCSPQPPTAAHTVAEYRANPELRRAQFARCANDPGTLGQTPDCINAEEATRIEDIGSLRDNPPLNLSPPAQKR